jgi:hypothetical protein
MLLIALLIRGKWELIGLVEGRYQLFGKSFMFGATPISPQPILRVLAITFPIG